MTDLGLTSRTDRRAFLGRLAVLGLGGASASLVSCGPDDEADRNADATPSSLEPITRPLLLPWSDDIIRIAAPISELPVAYLSMARRRVYIDLDFRDRAGWLLSAHISVSTGLWRVPLPGDPPGQPIQPGDEAREFEEVSIREWDPALPPAQDDVRVRRGNRTPTLVHFACIPGGGVEGAEWFSAGPWPIDVCAVSSRGTTREDFMRVGTGTRHRTRGCDDTGEPVDFITWACRPGEAEV